MTRSAPNGASTTTSSATRGMLGASAPGHGSVCRSTRPMGRREAMRLPKRWRVPCAPGRSTAAANKEHLVARKLPAQQLGLVFAFAAGQVGEARVNLLQAEHLGVRQASGFAHDAGGVDDAV